MTDRESARRVMAALQHTPLAQRAVLVGSSSLLGFETRVPALTEDIDVCVPTALVEAEGDTIARALEGQGFAHEHGTATFVSAEGLTFDLLGHGDPARGDHIAGHGVLRVMVFEDLSVVLAQPWAVEPLTQGLVLVPAAFVATKLLTERAHKGAKDKLQALLVMAEHRGDDRFAAQLVGLLAGTDPARLDDVRASSLEAWLSLGRDPLFRDAGAEGYAAHLDDARVGLERLQAFLERLGG